MQLASVSFYGVARKIIFFGLVFKSYSGFAKLMYSLNVGTIIYYYYKMGETVNIIVQ